MVTSFLECVVATAGVGQRTDRTTVHDAERVLELGGRTYAHGCMFSFAGSATTPRPDGMS
jgi:hypothetical protein